VFGWLERASRRSSSSQPSVSFALCFRGRSRFFIKLLTIPAGWVRPIQLKKFRCVPETLKNQLHGAPQTQRSTGSPTLAAFRAEWHAPAQVSASAKRTPVIRSVSLSFRYKAQAGMALVGIHARIAHARIEMMSATEKRECSEQEEKPVKTSLIIWGGNSELLAVKYQLPARQSRSH